MGQAFSAIVSIVGIRLITETTNPKIVGEAALWLGIIILLKNVFISPIGNYQLRYYPKYKFQGVITKFNKNIKLLYIRMFLLSSAIFIGGTFLLKHLKIVQVELILIPVLILYLAAEVVKIPYMNILSADRKQFLYASWLMTDVLFMFLFLFLALTIHNNLYGYIVGQSIGILLAALFFIVISFNKINENHSEAFTEITSWKKEIKSYSLPFVPLAIITWLLNLGNRYILNSYSELTEVGIFTVSFGIASRPFLFLAGIVANFFRPILFQKQSNNQFLQAERIFRLWLSLVLIIGLLVVAIFYLFGTHIGNILLAKEFRSNSDVLFVLIGSGYLFFSLYQVFENRLMSYEDSKSILLANIICGIVYIFSSIILISNMGILGAGIALPITFSVQLLGAYVYYLKRKNYKRHI